MKTFKRHLLGLFVLTAMLTLAACGGSSSGSDSENSSNSDLSEVYTNEEVGVEMTYPADYELQENVMGLTAAFLAPVDDENDLFRENMVMAVQDLSPEEFSLDEFNDLNMEQIEMFTTDFAMIDSGSTQLGGHDAYRHVYTGSQESDEFQWMQTWTVVDNVAYVLTFTASPETFTNYVNEMDAMVDSFSIL